MPRRRPRGQERAGARLRGRGGGGEERAALPDQQAGRGTPRGAGARGNLARALGEAGRQADADRRGRRRDAGRAHPLRSRCREGRRLGALEPVVVLLGDRKSTRLNSSHQIISYAVFCLKKKKTVVPEVWPNSSGGNRSMRAVQARSVGLTSDV